MARTTATRKDGTEEGTNDGGVGANRRETETETASLFLLDDCLSTLYDTRKMRERRQRKHQQQRNTEQNVTSAGHGTSYASRARGRCEAGGATDDEDEEQKDESSDQNQERQRS